MDGVSRDEQRAKRLMRSYARLQGSMAPIPTIVEDLKTNEPESMSDETVASYIKALKKIFVIEDMEAWNPNLRSKTAIRTSDNRYFVDPSLAIVALDLGPNDLMNDLNTFGLFFETLCVRDLRVFAETLHGKVYHYRDRSGLGTDGCRSVCLQTSEGWRFSGSNRLSEGLIVNKGIVTIISAGAWP